MDPKSNYWILPTAVAVIAVFGVIGLLNPAPPDYDYSNYDVNIFCAFPDVPETMPTLRTVYVPVNVEAAETIARDVFGITEAQRLSEDGDERLILGDVGVTLYFEGLYHLYFDYHSKKALTDMPEDGAAVEWAESIVSRLEEHWSTPMEVEYSLKGTREHRDHFNRSLPVVGLQVEYLQSYQGIEIGGQAPFAVSVADGEPIYACIQRPVVEVEGCDPITVTPEEAVVKALSGESAWILLGHHIMRSIPTRGKVNVTDIRLIYFYEDTGKTDYLIPVYYIEAEVSGPSLDSGLPVTVTLREVIFASERILEKIS